MGRFQVLPIGKGRSQRLLRASDLAAPIINHGQTPALGSPGAPVPDLCIWLDLGRFEVVRIEESIMKSGRLAPGGGGESPLPMINHGRAPAGASKPDLCIWHDLELAHISLRGRRSLPLLYGLEDHPAEGLSTASGRGETASGERTARHSSRSRRPPRASLLLSRGVCSLCMTSSRMRSSLSWASLLLARSPPPP